MPPVPTESPPEYQYQYPTPPDSAGLTPYPSVAPKPSIRSLPPTPSTAALDFDIPSEEVIYRTGTKEPEIDINLAMARDRDNDGEREKESDIALEPIGPSNPGKTFFGIRPRAASLLRSMSLSRAGSASGTRAPRIDDVEMPSEFRLLVS